MPLLVKLIVQTWYRAMSKYCVNPGALLSLALWARTVPSIVQNLFLKVFNVYKPITTGSISIFRCLHPVQMVFGFLSVLGAFSLFVYVSNNQAQFRRFKRKYPGASIFIILLGGYFLIHLFGSVITFLFGIALPLLRKYDWMNLHIHEPVSIQLLTFPVSAVKNFVDHWTIAPAALLTKLIEFKITNETAKVYKLIPW